MSASPQPTVSGAPMDLVAASLVCSLGYDLDTACAAARAGLVRPGPAAGFRTRSAVDGEPEAVSVHAARLLTDGFQDDGRLVRLLQGAAADLRRRLPLPAGASRIACYLCVPSPRRLLEGAALVDDEAVRARMEAGAARAGEPPDPAPRVAGLLARAWAAAGWTMPAELVHVVPGGHAGGAQALARAAADLAAGRVDLAVVGGVESWLDEDTLQWLLDTGRLKCDAIPAGFQPGEAASLLALRRASGDERQARLGPVALAQEPRAAYSGLPSFGEGSSAAIAAVLADPERPAWLVADLNGETHRAHEWGNALVRLRAGRSAFDAPVVWTPAAAFGDVGSASVPVAVCVALRAGARRAAPAPRAIVCAASDGPVRAAVALELPRGTAR